MSRSSSSLAVPLTLVLASVAACGLRSDPFAPDYVLDGSGGVETETDDGPGDPNRPGTCNDPLIMPFAPMTLRGELSGPSYSEGWCASDKGPEDIYQLVPEGYDVDVTLTLLPEETDDDLAPTLRVVEDGCAPDTGFTKICTHSFVNEPFHFLARNGHVYSVMIDSPEGSRGRYGFRVDFGDPPLALCPVHPEVIEQLPGSSFLWGNDFSQGQGRADGYCGGPGRENMFALDASYPGNIYARVETSGDFAPALGIRTGCGGATELLCDADTAGQVAELVYFINQPGRYYLTVDQAQIGGGGYSLRVDFD